MSARIRNFRILMITSYTIFSLLIQSAISLYSSSDDVTELTATSFNQVYSSDDIWFVEFYAPWCGHCQKLAPEWKKAATTLKGVVKVAAVNADDHQSLAGQFSIQGFPTILIFAQNKRSPVTYKGQREHSAIVNEALNQVKLLVQSRLGGKSSRSDDSHSDVIKLTDDNFDTLVLKSQDPWLVEFFAPWCGHCKNLKPHWEQAASELKGVVKVGAVDATVNTRLSQKYGIQGYPTIKYFPAGKKDVSPIEYDGGRTASDIVSWATDKADALLPPPEIVEILSAEQFNEACMNHQLCLIAVLPSLYDCQSTCRNQYLNVLREQAAKHKKQKWGWLWTEAMKQRDMEKKFNIEGLVYPAMVAVHQKKMKYATLRGAFNDNGIHDFLRSLLLGDVKMSLSSVHSMPTIETVDAWDGNDAPPLELFDDDLGVSHEDKKDDL